ncbi:hypothetical protein CBL_20111, partial [Carabus blaptoides fortunei]
MAIGKLFYGAKSISNNTITDIKANGRNRIKITFKTGEEANKMLDSNFLNNNQLMGYIPFNSIVRYGIIKHVDTKLTETELINNINSQSNHSENHCPPSTQPQCANCHKDHKSNDKKCNEYLAQVDIKCLMSFKNISYYDAQTEVKGRAYAEVTTNNLNNNKEFPALVQEDKNPYTPTQTFTQANTHNKNTSQTLTKNSQNNTREDETRNTFPTENRNITLQIHKLHKKTQQTSEKQITHELEQIKNQGGTAILIRKDIPYIEVDMSAHNNEQAQIAAADIFITNQYVRFISVYTNPNTIKADQWSKLAQGLSKP